MYEGRFKIVFEKLAQSVALEGCADEPSFQSEAWVTELEEIAELRRLSLAIAEPEPTSYTTT